MTVLPDARNRKIGGLLEPNVSDVEPNDPAARVNPE
jgi:hypothetical protein